MAIEPAVPPAAGTQAPRQTAASERGAEAVKPIIAPVVPVPSAAAKSAAKADSPAAKTPPKIGAPPEPTGQAAKKDSAAPDLAKQATAPPLDLKSLETRLKETKAIGVFTKLALKNQVDDLLDRFRAYYQGRLKTTLADLRQPYELLILKVLALLQDADPPLAHEIVASREAIWGILADPAKFQTLSKLSNVPEGEAL